MLTRLFRVTFICLIAAGVIFSSPFGINCAHASGIGFYLSRGIGDGDTDFNEDYDDDDSWYDLESSGDAKFFGCGFIFDTAVAKDKVFNYRLQIGYEDVEYDLDSVYNEDLNMDISAIVSNFELNIDRFVLDNTFGFGIVRMPNFRLWIGPQLRIGYMSGDGTMTLIDRTKCNLDFDGLVLGIAPVMGANFNLINNLTIGVDLGYRFNFFVGSLDKTSFRYFDSGNFYGNDDTFFINFAFIYRFNDNF
ncbi:MAG: hypothetical protein DRH21_04380 [Deltaproteobacteria bacterium]|nr:MAG: hypothetical protein DRH21_04380 [Deltaproteobacteria bacterium]